MIVDLPYPHKALWPNGSRPHWRLKAAEARKHKAWAFYSCTPPLAFTQADSPIPVAITVHPKPTGPFPDRDNCIAAAKSYLDGIADWLTINDRCFAAPTVEFAAERTSRFIIQVGKP